MSVLSETAGHYLLPPTPTPLSKEARRSRVRRSFDRILKETRSDLEFVRNGSVSLVFWYGNKEAVVKPYWEDNVLLFSIVGQVTDGTNVSIKSFEKDVPLAEVANSVDKVFSA